MTSSKLYVCGRCGVGLDKEEIIKKEMDCFGIKTTIKICPYCERQGYYGSRVYRKDYDSLFKS